MATAILDFRDSSTVQLKSDNVSSSGEEFGYPVHLTHSTVHEPKEFDKITSADGDTTPEDEPNSDGISNFSRNTRENTGLLGVSEMVEASVSNVSPGESKESMQSGNRC